MYCNQSYLVTDTETIMSMLSLTQEGAPKEKKTDQETIGERALKETPGHKKKASSYQNYRSTHHSSFTDIINRQIRKQHSWLNSCSFFAVIPAFLKWNWVMMTYQKPVRISSSTYISRSLYLKSCSIFSCSYFPNSNDPNTLFNIII